VQKVKPVIRAVQEAWGKWSPRIALHNLVLKDTRNTITFLVRRKLKPWTVHGLVAQTVLAFGPASNETICSRFWGPRVIENRVIKMGSDHKNSDTSSKLTSSHWPQKSLTANASRRKVLRTSRYWKSGNKNGFRSQKLRYVIQPYIFTLAAKIANSQRE